MIHTDPLQTTSYIVFRCLIDGHPPKRGYSHRLGIPYVVLLISLTGYVPDEIQLNDGYFPNPSL
jgi:hypothetical protein